MIIPAYNEEGNIIKTVKQIKEYKHKKIKLDYVVVNDGSRDGTRELLVKNDINYVDKLINEIVENDCDLVVGSRFVGNESSFLSTKSRRVGINLLSGIIKLFTGKVLKDVTSGYRAANREIIERFFGDYVFEYPEPITNLQIIKAGYKVKEVPVNMNERVHGKSSISFSKSIYYMLNVGVTMVIFGIGGKR